MKYEPDLIPMYDIREFNIHAMDPGTSNIDKKSLLTFGSGLFRGVDDSVIVLPASLLFNHGLWRVM